MSNIPSPAITTETAAFWAHANEGRFVVPRCKSCSKYHWYPRANCPFCTSDAVELVPSSGKGTIYSYSVSRRGKDSSYTIAYVTLSEGVTLMTNIVNAKPDALAIGKPVRVAMIESESGQRVPMFELA